jgi:hypothetical protein
MERLQVNLNDVRESVKLTVKAAIATGKIDQSALWFHHTVGSWMS